MSQLATTSEESLESLVAGLADEFADRLERGERPNPDEFAGRYPEHASVIRQVLSCLNLVRLSTPTANGPGPADGELQGVLGDYRLIREIGRGGMGVVYEAEQVSLRRRVALKVLPFASALDPRHLQRFRNEAHAAAQLHHTNIVPVYAVGFERGIHFYAMQFIEGRSLAEVVRDLHEQDHPGLARRPADAPNSERASSGAETAEKAGALSTELSARGPGYFRAIARLGIQAAEALEYAHQRGVIHRDVKPANLLVDNAANLWIADFGLAQVRSDARLTMTGDLLGTLRYMCPEQALGQRDQADQRGDVYSLGITLYELLTLQPAFPGNDRKELLRQIAFDEPKPPRRVNRNIPAELETIVHKAIAKVPNERYASAQQLADDLRSFLEDRPIRAKPPSLTLRLRKWARRHRTLVGAATVVAAITLVVAGAAGGWYLQERSARRTEFVRDVEARCTEAQILAAEAEKVREKPAQWQSLLTGARSALSRAETLMQGKEAATPAELRSRVEQLRGELDAEELDRQLLADVEEIRLQTAEVDSASSEYQVRSGTKYAAALSHYGIQVGVTPPELAGERIRSRSAAVASRIAAVLDHWLLNAAEDEAMWLSRVLAVADSDSWRTEIRVARARKDLQAMKRLAESVVAPNQPTQTLVHLAMFLRHYRRLDYAVTVISLLQPGYARHPADFWVNHELGCAWRDCDPPRIDKAIHYFTAAAALRPESLGAWLELGDAHGRKGNWDEATAACKKALELSPGFSAGHASLGLVLHQQGKLEDAVAAYREAIRIQQDNWVAHMNLGVVLTHQNKLDDAIAECREATRLRPKSAMAHTNLASALLRQGKLNDAIDSVRQAISVNPRYSLAHYNLGILLSDQKKHTAAVDAYREALKLDPRYVNAALNLGNVLIRLNRFREAVAAFDQAIRANPIMEQAHRNRAVALHEQGLLDKAIAGSREAIRLVPSAVENHYILGNSLRDCRELDEATACLRQAIRLNPNFAEAWCNLGQVLGQRGDFQLALATLRRGHELGQKTPDWSYPSAEWVRQAERNVLIEGKLPGILSGDHVPANAEERGEIALVLFCKRSNNAAFRFFDEAFKSQPALRAKYRLEATSAAVLATCGLGDAVSLTEQERTYRRQRAFNWLRADLLMWTKQLDSENRRLLVETEKNLRLLRFNPDLDGVRDGSALAKLSETERKEWQQLWRDVIKAINNAASFTENKKPDN
jgi:serine/threonine protein kinase/Tfp pilus assembly protein PilF